MCECADFESLFSKVAWTCFPLCIKMSCYIVIKCVGARGGVERESESECIRGWKINNLVCINVNGCAALVGLNKFERIEGIFFL